MGAKRPFFAAVANDRDRAGIDAADRHRGQPGCFWDRRPTLGGIGKIDANHSSILLLQDIQRLAGGGGSQPDGARQPLENRHRLEICRLPAACRRCDHPSQTDHPPQQPEPLHQGGTLSAGG